MIKEILKLMMGMLLAGGAMVLAADAQAQTNHLKRPDMAAISRPNTSGNVAAAPKPKKKKSQQQRTEVRVIKTEVKQVAPKVYHQTMEEAYRQGLTHYRQGNFTQAYPLLESAATRDHDEAQLLLGLMHRTGSGCDQSAEKAFTWLRLSAFNCNPYAQFFYGESLLYGEGCDEDATEAATWLRKAAEEEIGDAQLLLAAMFERGVGVGQSMEEAFRWYKSSARLNIYEACYKLADFYENGIGTRPNQTQAAKWRARGEELEELDD